MFTTVGSCVFVGCTNTHLKGHQIRNRNRLVLLCMGSISAGEETRLHLTTKSAAAADMRRQQLQILLQKFWQLVLAVLNSQECSFHLLQNATANPNLALLPRCCP